jgi:uncharacterized repeat protein (TIGR01451 family)
MKRNVLRIVALASVLVLGGVAILRTQRATDTPAAQKPPQAAAAVESMPPPRLPDVPASPIANPRPAIVYRASEIPPASVAMAGDPSPATVQTSANQPLPPVDNAAPPDPFAHPATPVPPASGPNAASDPQGDRGSRQPPALLPAAIPANPLRSSDPAPGVYDRHPLRDPQMMRVSDDSQPAPTQGSPRIDSTPSALPPRQADRTETFAMPAQSSIPAQNSLPARMPEPAKMPGPGAGARELHPREMAAGDSVGDPAAEGSGQPGKKNQEGPQIPQLTIQKFAPEAVQVGKPALFRVTVANTGQVPAHGLEVRDQIPKGTQLLSTKPHASRGTSGEVIWELGTLKPGDEVSAEMEIMPVAEGELGSVATVRFNADASARTIATKPELVIKCAAASQVLIGDEVTMSITVSNPGSGVANNVVLKEQMPEGLHSPTGTDLEFQVGTLKPGEQRQIQLPVTAVRAGRITNILRAYGEGNLRAEDRCEMEVLSPQLGMTLDGPKRRFLEREATYTVAISNTGTAPAKQVELVAYLPRGLKFVSANNAGTYEPTNQTVHWILTELPASDTDKVELVTLPIEAGEHKLRLEGKADKGLSVEKEQPVTVEGIAAIKFEVNDTVDPIEKGGETVYEIHVANQGSKAANNVRVVAMLPPGMRALAAEGPTRNTLEASRVQFESLAQLAPKAETTYRVRVQGLRPGDLRVRVQLLTDEMQEPVTKEESTRVYADE